MPLTLERRMEPSRTANLLVPILSIVLALAAGGVLLWLAGVNPIETYRAMLHGAFGSAYAISETLVRATPLMLTGLAVSVAFRMLFWNIGAEGQLAMGAFAASGVALFLPKLMPGISAWLLLPLMLVGGFLGGALWALIPAMLKAFLSVNEIITTLMLNYVAILWIQYLYYGPWKDPLGFGFPGTAPFVDAAWLPRLKDTAWLPQLFNTGRLHWGLALAIVAAIVVWLILDRTRWGYEIKIIGENSRAARYAGISIVRNILLVMILSGGLAGLAGFVQVAGISHRLQQGIAVGDGYTAIIIAWLARLNPFGVLVVALLMAALFVGGDQIQISMGLPAAVAGVLQGAILFCVLGGNFFTLYRVRWTSRRA
ncbi:MAG TPA: ABC transporter permease, partial [Anaerolineae bacterium]|nr:ABC transporter permease [Anaerolineae bacterium]